MKPSVLLDCDGVLSDLLGKTVSKLAEAGMPMTQEVKDWEIRKYLNKDQLDFMYKLWDSDGFVKTLDPYPGAVDAVRNLRKIANVHVLTSHWDSSKSWVQDRTWWLQEHFGFNSKQVTFSHDKHAWWGDLFVDDHIKNVGPWSAKWPDSIAILWEQPYNQTMEFPNRLNNWSVLWQMVHLLSKGHKNDVRTYLKNAQDIRNLTKLPQ